MATSATPASRILRVQASSPSALMRRRRLTTGQPNRLARGLCACRLCDDLDQQAATRAPQALARALGQLDLDRLVGAVHDRVARPAQDDDPGGVALRLRLRREPQLDRARA